MCVHKHVAIETKRGETAMSKTDSLLQEVCVFARFVAVEIVSVTMVTILVRCTCIVVLPMQVADIQGEMYCLKQSLYTELRVSRILAHHACVCVCVCV